MRKIQTFLITFLAIAFTAFMPVSFAATLDYQVPQFEVSAFTLDNQAEAVADKVHIDSGGLSIMKPNQLENIGVQFREVDSLTKKSIVLSRVESIYSSEVAGVSGRPSTQLL
jgi:hypothetical protein